MPRYKLRTLLILLAVLPPLLWVGWGKYQAWKADQERQRALREAAQQQRVIIWPGDGSRPPQQRVITWSEDGRRAIKRSQPNVKPKESSAPRPIVIVNGP